MWYAASHAPKKPFRARWIGPDDRKKSKGFPTEKARADFAAAWVAARKEHGAAAQVVDGRLVEAWAEADRISGGVNPVVLAQFYADFHGVAGGRLTFKEARKRFKDIRADKTVARDTTTHMDLHLDRLEAVHGGLQLNRFQPDTIRKWLRGLKNPDREDGKFSRATLSQHLTNVGIFFEAMVAERLTDHNPCAAVVLEDEPEKDKVILTPRQAFDFFKANQDARCIGAAAVECFGGLRFTSAARLTLDRIKDERKGIEMPGHQHKSKKRKFRQGHPHNLWSWLDHAPDSCWQMNQHVYNLEKRASFVAAKLKPAAIVTAEEKAAVAGLRNVFRNSFASYLLALSKNTPLVSYLMQHSSTKITEVYEGVADERDALLYFALTPDSVAMEWDAFVEWALKKKPEDLMPGL